MGRVFFNVRKDVHSLTASYQALTSDSGKYFMLNAAAGLTVTLPTVADAQEGWHCTLIVGTVTTSNNYIITESTGTDTDVIISHLVEMADTAGPTNTGHTTITFASTPALNDRVEIFCDGSKYYAVGLGVADAAQVQA
jgi:hypothetical protein